MSEQLVNRVIRIIEDQAKNIGAYPDYVRFMRLALLMDQPGGTRGARSHLLAMPGLCCQLSGGQPEDADHLTAAWICFYQAAHLMDSVQDGDQPDAWWEDEGPAMALNLASGYYFVASLILQQLHQIPIISDAAEEIIDGFYRSFFIMNIGQYRELTSLDLDLDQYWQNVLAKSGAFFALACWGGARLCTVDEALLNNFHILGENIGLLIQVKDDLEEVAPPSSSGVPGQRPKLVSSLPVIYAMEVLPPKKRMQLSRALEDAPTRIEAAEEVIRLIDGCGAVTYVQLEIERRRQQAIDALSEIDPKGSRKDSLYKLILSL